MIPLLSDSPQGNRCIGQIANIQLLIRVVLLAFAAMWTLSANAGFTFTPRHLYSASNGSGSADIYEYSETGTFLSSITPQSLIPGDELRGIAFGPDGFLYAVKIHFAESGFNILALDSSGNVQVTYTMGGIYLGGDSGYGKIVFDQQYSSDAVAHGQMMVSVFATTPLPWLISFSFRSQTL